MYLWLASPLVSQTEMFREGRSSFPTEGGTGGIVCVLSRKADEFGVEFTEFPPLMNDSFYKVCLISYVPIFSYDSVLPSPYFFNAS